MNLFDILGPVMVGPSSSHTAGAVRIGLISRRLLGSAPVKAEIYLHGSFAATGAGHGTDRALVAGLLGMEPDDSRIPRSYEVAEEEGLSFTMEHRELRGAHPNTAELHLTAANGDQVSVRASSIGGGSIVVNQLDGVAVNFTGSTRTLVVHNMDRPGLVSEVSSILAFSHVNIATMQLFRDKKGGAAVMVVEIDSPLSPEAVSLLEQLSGVQRVTYLDGM